MGPGTAGVPVWTGTTAPGNVAQLLARADVDAAALPRRFPALATEYVPMMVGLAGFRPYMISIRSDAHVGWDELRPLALGAAMAVAFLHREFTAYALPALFLVHVVEARGRIGALVRPWELTTFAFVVMFQAINALKPYADLMGPGTAGVQVWTGTTAPGNVAQLLARADVDLAAVPRRFRALATEYVPMMVGLAGFRPYMISIGSDAHVGWEELLPIATVPAAVLLVWLLADLVRRRSLEGIAFPISSEIMEMKDSTVLSVQLENMRAEMKKLSEKYLTRS